MQIAMWSPGFRPVARSTRLRRLAAASSSANVWVNPDSAIRTAILSALVSRWAPGYMWRNVADGHDWATTGRVVHMNGLHHRPFHGAGDRSGTCFRCDVDPRRWHSVQIAARKSSGRSGPFRFVGALPGDHDRLRTADHRV